MRSATCQYCGADIVWGRTELGRWLPLDRWCTDKGNLVIDPASRTVFPVQRLSDDYLGIRRTSHLATCPKSIQGGGKSNP